jgi:5-methylcytosine-specific restriction endonuclease McrA
MDTTTNTTPKPPRYNASLKFPDWLPARRDGFCRCGCGQRARRVWFSDECAKRKVEEFGILKGDGAIIRAAVFRRDRGICKGCGLDTEAARRAVQKSRQWWITDTKKDERERYFQRGFPPPSRSWWEADHILEVVRGGGGCGLENFQTLCCECHKAKTGKLAGDLARERAESNREKTAVFGNKAKVP